MTETTSLRTMLLPELESEFAKTRRVLEALPDFAPDYKPHEKSFSVARLAGHTAELPRFVSLTLTSPDLDFGLQPNQPRLHYETKPQILAAFHELADKAITDLKNTSDQTLNQPWKLSFKGHEIFSGSRYAAYRDMALNHLIHHRAQLTVYLRLLNQPVPGIFGPSADEPFGA